MKKLVVILMAVAFVATMASMALAGSNPLKANEKAFHKEVTSWIPKDMYRTTAQLHAKWLEVLAGKSKAYLLDVRTHPEFAAFHIEGSSHIHAGHMYTIPKKIKDPNAEIWVYCRTQHRAGYVAGMLYKYGYKNVYYVSKDGKVPGGVVGWAAMGYPFVNYFAGQFKITQYMKQGSWSERNCGNYIREFAGQRGEICGKKTMK
ncbi:MAG: rhodanese-like domain-containing protein [Desulfarculaceae bacterium]|nr:rhodanese-like domain-containing protein [Desulfarculaceae bacterium]